MDVRFSRKSASSSRAEHDAVVEHLAQVGVAGRCEGLAQVGQVGGELLIAEPVSRWVASTALPSSMSLVVSGSASMRPRRQRVAGVEQPLQVAAAAGERRAQLVDDGAQVLAGRPSCTSRSRLSSSVSVGSGVRGPVARMRLPSARYGPSRRGCRSRYCSPTAERFSTTARCPPAPGVPVEPQVDPHAVARRAAAGRPGRRPRRGRSPRRPRRCRRTPRSRRHDVRRRRGAASPRPT